MPDGRPRAAKPTRQLFDPFNSSATGHQRADNRLSGSTSWRDSRSLKLRQQFVAGAGGGKRMQDTVGAGSLDFGLDGRTENGGWVKGAKGLRTNGQQSIQEAWRVTNPNDDDAGERPSKRLKPEPPTSLVNPFTPFRNLNGHIRETSWPSHHSQQKEHPSPSELLSPLESGVSQSSSTNSNSVLSRSRSTAQALEESSVQPEGLEQRSQRHATDTLEEEHVQTGQQEQHPKQIFANCTIYLNGSTAPLISDHKLKHLLSLHGANMSISLGRRTVTHVILGTTSKNGGCGGGLAGSKIQKEVAKVRGKGVKFVVAEWVIESIKAGKRLPEGQFQAMKLAAKGQQSVADNFRVDKGIEGIGKSSRRSVHE